VTSCVGNKVLLSTRHCRTTRPLKNLEFKCTGPYTVSKIIIKNAYKLDLPKAIRYNNVFHALQLDHYTPPVVGQPSLEPHPVIVDDSEEWEIELILHFKHRYWKLHYLIQWAGYNHILTSWEPLQNLENAQELIDEFHWDHLNKPQSWRKSDLASGGIDGMEILRCRSLGRFLLSISFCLDPVQYKWCWHRFYHLQKCSQLEVELPCAPEGHPGQYGSVVGCMRSSEYVCGVFLCSTCT